MNTFAANLYRNLTCAAAAETSTVSLTCPTFPTVRAARLRVHALHPLRSRP